MKIYVLIVLSICLIVQAFTSFRVYIDENRKWYTKFMQVIVDASIVLAVIFQCINI